MQYSHCVIETPFSLWLWSPTAQVGCKSRAELVAPAADGLVGDEHAPLEHELFHAAIAEGEAVVEAHAVGDDGGRIAVLAVGRGRRLHRAAPLLLALILLGFTANVTVPYEVTLTPKEPAA
jgi:hypothetical protein